MVRESPAAYRITDLSADERPRERLEKSGPEALSKAELLAILLRVGVTGLNSVQLAQKILDDLGGLAGIQKASFAQVCNIHGVGPAKAAQIKAAIELGIRLKKENPDLSAAVNSPEDAAELVRYDMQGLVQENLWVILLDTRNRKIGVEKVYVGSLNASMVRVGELFRGALQRSAAGIIIAHNHPSGDPAPSPEDVTLTRAAVQAGKLLDVEVLDHLVIGHNSFVSMKEKGLGFG
ncbi:MAG: JAB domain-containing protein [Anaerolineae bacterium]|nr:JAB domain-containing protein [Anaerolineae bacterium]